MGSLVCHLRFACSSHVASVGRIGGASLCAKPAPEPALGEPFTKLIKCSGSAERDFRPPLGHQVDYGSA